MNKSVNSMTCADCGSVGTFESTTSGVDELLLCTECGFMDLDGATRFRDEDDPKNIGEFQMDNGILKYDAKNGLRRGWSRTDGRRKQYILEAVGLLDLPIGVKNATLALFERVVAIAGRASPTLSLACLFVTANHGGGGGGGAKRHIPLRDFCRRLHCDRYQLAKAKRWILAQNLVSISAEDREETVDGLIAKRLAENDIPIKYERKLKTLMMLVRKGWVSEGKADEMSLWPCLYHLLDNEEKSGRRPRGGDSGSFLDGSSVLHRPRTTTKTKFYKNHHIDLVYSIGTFLKHVQDVETLLTSLTRHVPWLPPHARGHREGFVKALEWMVDNEQFFHQVIEEGNCEEKEGEGKEYLPPIMSRKNKNHKNNTLNNNNNNTAVVSVKVPEGEELGEEDIPDDDMNEYIRTPQEIEAIAQLRHDLP